LKVETGLYKNAERTGLPFSVKTLVLDIQLPVGGVLRS